MKPLKVLLVEDDSQHAQDMRDLLEGVGPNELEETGHDRITADVARNQVEATRAARKPYDIILLDLQYPVKGRLGEKDETRRQGMEWLPVLRSQQKNAAIVILTRFAEVDNAVRAMREHGADDFVVKGEKFPAILERALRAYRHIRELERGTILREEYRILLRSFGMRTFAHEVGALISRANLRLLRIAQEVESGQPSAIAHAPSSIKDITKQLKSELKEAAKLLGEPGQIVTVELVNDVIKPLDALCETSLNLHVPSGSLLKIHTYVDELKIAVYEVVQNAVDTGAEEITVTLARAGKDVLVHVRDDGGGFTEQAKAHRFELGFTTRKQDGRRGLGLNIARRMIRSIGGSLEIKDERNGAHVILCVKDLGEQ